MSAIVPLPAPFNDDRGTIQNLVDTALGSALVILSKKGAVRANHYHKSDFHYSWLQSGKMIYAHRPVGSAEPPAQWVIGPGQLFHTPSMHEHVMHFLEDSVLFIVARNIRTSTDYESDTIRIPPLVLKPQG
jgi:dTDP-4-dehydrorhamnose 3,5-epimerase-like enzyme